MKIFNISFDTELKKMKQKSNEIINSYYKRLLILMLKYEIKNRFLTENLFFLKFVILNVIMKTFVRDLLNDEIRKKTIRELFAAERFFRKLCSLTENVDRSKKNFRNSWKKKKNFENWSFTKIWCSDSCLKIDLKLCWSVIKRIQFLQIECRSISSVKIDKNMNVRKSFFCQQSLSNQFF